MCARHLNGPKLKSLLPLYLWADIKVISKIKLLILQQAALGVLLSKLSDINTSNQHLKSEIQ